MFKKFKKLFGSHNRKAREPFLSEKDAQKSLADILGARMEIPYGNREGRIDILDYSIPTVIEVKKASGFKSAFGQVMCYNLEYPDHFPMIALLGDTRLRRRINEIGEQWAIGVVWADKDGTWEIGWLPKLPKKTIIINKKLEDN